MVEAILQLRLSASLAQIEDKAAIEAEPEIGRNITIGVKSAIRLAEGKILPSKAAKSFNIPQDFNKDTAITIAITEGNTSVKRFNPSLHPLAKIS